MFKSVNFASQCTSLDIKSCTMNLSRNLSNVSIEMSKMTKSLFYILLSFVLHHNQQVLSHCYLP